MSVKTFVILVVLFLGFSYWRFSVLHEARAPMEEECQSICRTKYADKLDRLKINMYALWGTDDFGVWDFWVLWKMPDGARCFCTIEEVDTYKLKARKN